jgi:hypothetical protein
MSPLSVLVCRKAKGAPFQDLGEMAKEQFPGSTVVRPFKTVAEISFLRPIGRPKSEENEQK